MADIVLTRPGVPVLTKNQGLVFSTAPVDDGDDLVLDGVEQPPMQWILCTPGAAVASLGSISDGQYVGQTVKLLVADAQTLRVPAALGNVDAAANLDATKDSPLELVWNGVAWQAA
jgi:hypothetical protein